MSTNDVPGANPANADKLGAGSWAEHEDGSLIFVKGTERGDVVYEMFDLSRPGDQLSFTDAIKEDLFKQLF